MALIPTKQLIDEYLETRAESFVTASRIQIDRPELYAYENKIGKQLVEMNVDEAYEMISTVSYKKAHGTVSGLQPTTITQIIHLYREVVNYYIEHYGLVYNAFANRKMKGVSATREIAKFNKPFMKEDLEGIIESIHETYDEPRASYLECMLLLFYNGFAKSEEIVRLTEDMINFRTRQVSLPGRTITLSQRCLELLQFVHDLDEMPSVRQSYRMLSWNGGYFKFPVRQKEADGFDSRSIQRVRESIGVKITKEINMELHVNVEIRTLYLLGFYDMMCEKVGKEHTEELLLAVRDSDAAEELMNYASIYGIQEKNVTVLKKYMSRFIGAK